jgi:hypothetical protein
MPTLLDIITASGIKRSLTEDYALQLQKHAQREEKAKSANVIIFL